jgi:ABC-type Fe3+-siderophore transport system permease subunit
VSVDGLTGFVWLIVPHGIRLLVGNDYRWLLPLSAIGGSLVLTLVDLLARMESVESPVGVVIALYGSRYLFGYCINVNLIRFDFEQVISNSRFAGISASQEF